MRFVIVGYGRVGSRTARIMTEEGHDVVVVDNDPDRIDRAESDGFETVRGDGADEATLVDAGIEDAVAIGAFTPDLNVNFAACMVGDHHGCRTVLRIDEDYRQDIYEKYAADVDEIIYPERLGAAGAKTAMLGGDFNVVADIASNLQLTVLEIADDSPAVGKRMSELELPGGARIYAHGRARDSLTIPLPGTELAAGDEIAVITETDRAEEVRETLLPASA
ncbi:TrkA family potassium uptake protein [Haloterrigena sp. SYSU A558-1]|uniref:TrkA family potassium uptake protein n=1 Tax=Haloterrigena gelatinilytica TaxID=2741724 RepID=A0A8J8GN07_9EURY|nr:TrkA family potassium uptake protein [Haloterrigena gelatinilytica]NUB92671.1 TrkA family potassium uptake protein [Haloterrigena gelatinilytica]NUC71413.1 TrkA family potassium uptake protein [Haloterrigena gelatinilytica]